ncbi:MAG: carboxypeptidase-like regulatory domain-containing protein, partial [Terriglobales bacterium]
MKCSFNRLVTWRAFRWVGGALLVACSSLGLTGQQNVTASLTGTVTDPTGAVIPSATITVRNIATGAERSVTTGSQGDFGLPLLPPGAYTVTAGATGFSTQTSNGLELHVGEQRRLNLQLQTAAVTQQITVSSAVTAVQTATAAQQQTITGTQIRELELNNRNFEQLVTLQPGVSSQLPDTVGFGLQNTTALSVNGARTSQNNWEVDGADINDSGSNLTITNVPSVDALQEFTLARSTYDAQYGRSSGGQVAVATKSGTNGFHGDAYEFVRNNIFNANSYFANQRPPQPGKNRAFRAPLRYNDFGYTIGGPLVTNHTFFFFSEEWRRTRTPNTGRASIPDPQTLTGNFQGIATLNPAGAPPGCIIGNTINPNCISPNAKAYVNNVYAHFTPDPGSCAGGSCSLTSTLNGLNDYRQEIVRLDQTFATVQLFGRYMQDKVPSTEPGGLFAGSLLPGISSTATNAPGRNVVAHVIWTLSPTLINEAAYNYSWGAINSNLVGIIGNAAGFAGLSTATFPFRDPYGRVPGISFPGSGLSGVAIPAAPYHERNIDKQAYDNLSWAAGPHGLRTGFVVQHMRKTENGPAATNGNFTFRNANGNPAFANFLLGNAFQFTQASRDIIPDLRFTNFEAYVQDDWKVMPRLTLNLGLRYSYLPTPHDAHNILDNFDPATFNRAAAPAVDPATGNFAPGGVTPAVYLNGIIVSRQNSPYGRRVNPNQETNFGPRLGFSWDPTGQGRTAIRGGYGIYSDRTLNGIWEQNQFVNPPFVNELVLSNANFVNPTSGTAP